MAAYSYDPTKCAAGNDFNQMRFELGDTDVAGGAKTCGLSDEEYTAMIEKANAAGRGWNYAKYLCVSAILAQFAYEVDTSHDGVSFQLSQRYERWTKIRADLERGMQHPAANSRALGVGAADGGHYFYYGMGQNPRAICPPSPYRNK